MSVTVTLLAADHGKMLPAPVIQTSSATELHAVSSQLSLQSIQEQDVGIFLTLPLDKLMWFSGKEWFILTVRITDSGGQEAVHLLDVL